MGIGPIPVDRIYAAAAYDGLSRGETDDLVEIIRRVDNHIVAKAARDTERRSKPAKPSGNDGRYEILS